MTFTLETCPKCYSREHQIKDGRTPSGNQRLRCKNCGCRYTPQPRERGYDEETRLQALNLHLEGISLRGIARMLEVNHQTVANWINAYANHLPADMPQAFLKWPNWMDFIQLSSLLLALQRDFALK